MKLFNVKVQNDAKLLLYLLYVFIKGTFVSNIIINLS